MKICVNKYFAPSILLCEVLISVAFENVETTYLSWKEAAEIKEKEGDEAFSEYDFVVGIEDVTKRKLRSRFINSEGRIMETRKGEEKVGIPYMNAGYAWIALRRHFHKNPVVLETVEKELILPFDAYDNGHPLQTGFRTIPETIELFEPTSVDDEEKRLELRKQAMGVIYDYLQASIKYGENIATYNQILLDCINADDEPGLVVYVPCKLTGVQHTLLNTRKRIIVYPHNDAFWAECYGECESYKFHKKYRGLVAEKLGEDMLFVSFDGKQAAALTEKAIRKMVESMVANA